MKVKNKKLLEIIKGDFLLNYFVDPKNMDIHKTPCESEFSIKELIYNHKNVTLTSLYFDSGKIELKYSLHEKEWTVYCINHRFYLRTFKCYMKDEIEGLHLTSEQVTSAYSSFMDDMDLTFCLDYLTHYNFQILEKDKLVSYPFIYSDRYGSKYLAILLNGKILMYQKLIYDGSGLFRNMCNLNCIECDEYDDCFGADEEDEDDPVYDEIRRYKDGIQ